MATSDGDARTLGVMSAGASGQYASWVDFELEYVHILWKVRENQTKSHVGQGDSNLPPPSLQRDVRQAVNDLAHTAMPLVAAVLLSISAAASSKPPWSFTSPRSLAGTWQGSATEGICLCQHEARRLQWPCSFDPST